jgi:hypothetical protein
MSVPAYQPYSPLGIPQKQQEKTQYAAWNPMGWYSSINSYRQRLNLPNPGKFERLHFETKGWYRDQYSDHGHSIRNYEWTQLTLLMPSRGLPFQVNIAFANLYIYYFSF